jgi:hypothetical protein
MVQQTSQMQQGFKAFAEAVFANGALPASSKNSLPLQWRTPNRRSPAWPCTQDGQSAWMLRKRS